MGAPHEAHEARRAAPPGRRSEARVHEAHVGVRRVHHQAVVGGGAHLGAAADRGPGQQRHADHPRPTQARQEVRHEGAHLQPQCRRCQHFPGQRQVGPGAKRVAVAAENQPHRGGRRPRREQAIDGFRQLQHHLPAEGVARAVVAKGQQGGLARGRDRHALHPHLAVAAVPADELQEVGMLLREGRERRSAAGTAPPDGPIHRWPAFCRCSSPCGCC